MRSISELRCDLLADPICLGVLDVANSGDPPYPQSQVRELSPAVLSLLKTPGRAMREVGPGFSKAQTNRQVILEMIE